MLNQNYSCSGRDLTQTSAVLHAPSATSLAINCASNYHSFIRGLWSTSLQGLSYLFLQAGGFVTWMENGSTKCHSELSNVTHYTLNEIREQIGQYHLKGNTA